MDVKLVSKSQFVSSFIFFLFFFLCMSLQTHCVSQSVNHSLSLAQFIYCCFWFWGFKECSLKIFNLFWQQDCLLTNTTSTGLNYSTRFFFSFLFFFPWWIDVWVYNRTDVRIEEAPWTVETHSVQGRVCFLFPQINSQFA